MLGDNGTLAQYTIVDPAVSIMVPKPREISHEEAAAFPLAGLTAWYALVNRGGLKKADGKRIFINGGSGGVGTWAIQVHFRAICSCPNRLTHFFADC
jgi:NADPH:quinone reductase-like Zn-dependent oxidoreductase